jgi:hypothetical protein
MVETNTIGDDERMNDSFKGATYRVERGEGEMYDIELIPHTPSDGFQVGAINGTYVQTHSPLELNALLRTCAYVHPNAGYVGYWLDDEGMYHIDPSHYYSEDEYALALNVALDLNQKAIWSFIQGEEITTATPYLSRFNEASEAPSEGSDSPKALEASVKVYHGSLTITNETLREVYDEVREHAALWTDEVDFGARTILRALYEKLEIVEDE